MVLDENFISDAKLAIHGSTGAQLANLPNVNSILENGVTWSSKDNVITATGRTENVYSVQTTIKCDIPIVPGNYYISGGDESINVVVRITNSSGSFEYYKNDKPFTITGNEKAIDLYTQVPPNTTVDNTIKVMLNKGNIALPFEVYTGGTPYTDKYTATITDQTEDNVRLSIKNVSATVGDITKLDVVLTDRNGITKRSETGKTFIGG